MTADHLIGIERFEADLWKVADNLRANSNLASNEYFMAEFSRPGAHDNRELFTPPSIVQTAARAARIAWNFEELGV